MKNLKSKEFGYIYNFWSDRKLNMTGDGTSGITWDAMVKAAKTNPEIAARVELYRHRVKEEFYDFVKDPVGYHNLINDPACSDTVNVFQGTMLKEMIKYKNSVYEMYGDRNKQGN